MTPCQRQRYDFIYDLKTDLLSTKEILCTSNLLCLFLNGRHEHDAGVDSMTCCDELAWHHKSYMTSSDSLLKPKQMKF